MVGTISFILFLVCVNIVYCDKVFDSNAGKVWGPGLRPHEVVFPARYFFVQAVNSSIESIIENYKVLIEGESQHKGKPCRIWHNTLDRKDGSFIVRYKVYEPCNNFKISIKYQSKHVAESPYVIDKTVYSDECDCPNRKINDLLKSWRCEDVPLQIKKDLGQFGKVDWSIERSKVIKQFDKPHSVSLCHYIIKNNEIYRKCYGKYVGFNMFSDSILLSLARKAQLPDLEFFINLGDWPLSLKNLPEKYPIFSWCGSTDTFDIVMPTYELTESALENMGRVMLDMLSVQGNVAHQWEKREPKLFWRGRDSNRHRLDLISLSREYPDLFNVSLTNFFFYRDEQDKYGPKSDHVSFFKFFDYKYQLAIDGTVSAYRMPFLLGGGSMIFKPYSKYYEHFYNDLEPNTHYIPVETNLSDLVEKINWAKSNDDEAKRIAQNGRSFGNNNLLPEHVFCYYLHLFNEFKKIVVSDIEVAEGMELVSQKKQIPCDCNNKNDAKDEL